MIFRDTDLKQQDRTNCALTCRALHQICTPFLWQAIKVKASRLKAFKEEAAQQALHKNASRVRELHLLYVDLFHVFLPRKRCSSPLVDCRDISDSERWREEVEEGYLPALCTNLKALQLHYFDDSVENHMETMVE